MSNDDYSLDPNAYTPHHAYLHHSRADQRQVILDLTRERDEARAEVERLRGEVDHWQQARNDALASGDVLKAEVERLRARPLQWPPPIGAGCVCPPGANRSCANSFCPRRDPPGVTCESMR